MININSANLTGRISKAPTLETVGETSVVRARILHNDVIRRKNKEPKTELVAIDVEIWGPPAVAFAEMVTPKTPVYLETALKMSEWKDQATGESRSKLYLRVDRWQFIERKAKEEEKAEA